MTFIEYRQMFVRFGRGRLSIAWVTGDFLRMYMISPVLQLRISHTKKAVSSEIHAFGTTHIASAS
jgi:hypothetical protein